MAQSKSGTKRSSAGGSKRRSTSGGSKRSSRSRSSSSSNGSSKLKDKDEMKERDKESQELEDSDEGSDDRGGNMSKAEESHTGGKAMGRPPADEPDVFVDIPQVHVGELLIDVRKLEAHLALRAEVANLVNLVAGVHVGIDEVKIDLKDVDAQAMLKVRLENTYNILDRTLTTLDENPEIVQGLLETADTAVQETGNIGKEATKPGGAVSQIGGGLGDTLGHVGEGLSGTLSGLGDGISNIAGKASPKKLLPSGNASGGSGRRTASKAGSNGGGAGRTALKAALAGAVGFVGAVAVSEASNGRFSRSPVRKALDKVKP